MRSFREGKVVILHWDSLCILKIGPFRKVSPEARQKTSQIELILGHNFESVSKRGVPKKGRKLERPKVTFWSQKGLSERFLKMKSPDKVHDGDRPMREEGESRVKSALGPPQRIKDPYIGQRIKGAKLERAKRPKMTGSNTPWAIGPASF